MGIFDFFNKSLSNYKLVMLLYDLSYNEFDERLVLVNNKELMEVYSLKDIISEKKFIDFVTKLCLIFKSLNEKNKFKTPEIIELQNSNLYKNTLLEEKDIIQHELLFNKSVLNHSDLLIKTLHPFALDLYLLAALGLKTTYSSQNQNVIDASLFLIKYIHVFRVNQFLGTVSIFNQNDPSIFQRKVSSLQNFFNYQKP